MRKLYFLLFFVLVIGANAYAQVPIISSISPSSGPVGTSVNISGSNFSATSANDVVYFGAVAATVTSASTSSLTVTVPAGASYGPVTVFNTSTTVPLVATSATAFTPTFTSKKTIVTADFDSRTDMITNSANAQEKQVGIADLNGDGLPDMVLIDVSTKTVQVFQHATNPSYFGLGTTTPYSPASTSPIYPASPTVSVTPTVSGTAYDASNFVVADFNGVVKPDLIVYANKTILIYQNTSSGGVLSFNNSTTPTTPTTSISAIGGNYMAVADMDGDGKLDIMIATGTAGTVKLYQNTTTGATLTFGSAVTINIFPSTVSAQYYAYTLAIGDMDGDGKPDIVVANQQATGVSTGYITIIRNTSSGPGTLTASSFASSSAFSIATGQQYVAANSNNIALGDIDGDGKLDIVVAEMIDKTVSVIQNTSTSGSLSFNSRVTMTTTAVTGNFGPRTLALADMDGDGRVDIVVDNYVNSTTTSNFAIFRNLTTTSGTLTTSSFPTSPITLLIGENCSYIALNDIDGDGRPDLIASDAYGTTGTNGTITLWHNNSGTVTISSISPASGAFGASVTITGTNFSSTAANNAVYFGAVAATVTSASATSLRVTVPAGASYGPITVINNNSKSFSYPLAATSTKYFTPTFTGIPGKTTINSTDFTNRTDLVINSTAGATKQVAVADLNGDGLPDMVVVDGTAKTLQIFQHASSNASFGSIYPSTGTTFAYTGNGTNAVSNFVLTDMNGDGKPDLVMTVNSNLYVYLNTSTTGGTISFNTTSAITAIGTGTVYEMAVADMDGDGKPDVLIAAGNNGYVKLLQNTTSGSTLSFASPITINTYPSTNVTQYYPYSIAVADMDGDGLPDIVTANQQALGAGTGYVNIIRNNSSGPGLTMTAASFQVGLTNSSIQTLQQVGATNSNNIALGDIDGDGKIDIVVAQGTDKKVSIFQNNTTSAGNFVFGASVDFTPSSNAGPRSVALADMDGDGRLDMVVNNYTTTSPNFTSAIFRNLTTTSGTLSTSSFPTTPTTLAIGENSGFVVANDINGDGKPDLISSNANGTSGLNSTVTLWQNSPQPSTDATLSALSISSGTLSPSFASGTYSYSATVTSGVSSITITPTVNFSYATVTVNGSTVTSGSASASINLSAVGTNTITTVVTAQDGVTTQTYTLTVVRAAATLTFSPSSGGVGTSVTITGNTFSSTAANNIVYFGAVKATVTSATTSQLIVTVPAGASYAPISVLNNETTNKPFTCYSQQFFTTTFASKNAITDQDIDIQTTIAAAGTSPGQVFSADLNGDGLPDLVVMNDINAANNVSIYIHNSPNTSYTSAYPSTPTYTLSTTLTGTSWGPMLLGDVDGDGKPDLLVAPSNGGNPIYVYLSSTATAGALFGSTPLTLTSANVPKGIAIGDLDGDGKVDVAVTNGSGNTVSLFRNTSKGVQQVLQQR